MPDHPDSLLAKFQGALHVVFSQSGGGILRQALRMAGLRGRVIAMPDHFGYGPIDPLDWPSRYEWLRREIGAWPEWPEQFDVLPTEVKKFWNQCDLHDRCVVWFSRRTLLEYCGFLEWVRRRETRPFCVVDFTDEERPPQNDSDESGLLISIAFTPPDLFPTELCLGRAAPLTSAERSHYIDSWRRLREDGAVLRVVDNGGVHSVPVTYYDEVLMSHARLQWTKWARVVGCTMAYGGPDNYIQVSDDFLGARVRKLVSEGRLESKGNLSRIGFSEVRLPGGAD